MTTAPPQSHCFGTVVILAAYVLPAARAGWEIRQFREVSATLDSSLLRQCAAPGLPRAEELGIVTPPVFRRLALFIASLPVVFPSSMARVVALCSSTYRSRTPFDSGFGVRRSAFDYAAFFTVRSQEYMHSFFKGGSSHGGLPVVIIASMPMRCSTGDGRWHRYHQGRALSGGLFSMKIFPPSAR